MNKRHWIFFLFFMIGSPFSMTLQAQDKGIIVKEAWVAALPPSEKVTAGFMTIENTTDMDVALTSVSTTAAQVTEIHQMSRVKGMMKMAMLKSLTIPAKAKIVLGPGGYHLMIIGLTEPIHQGQEIPLILSFNNGKSIEVKALVRPQEEEE